MGSRFHGSPCLQSVKANKIPECWELDFSTLVPKAFCVGLAEPHIDVVLVYMQVTELLYPLHELFRYECCSRKTITFESIWLDCPHIDTRRHQFPST
jgi:hypothetical protein